MNSFTNTILTLLLGWLRTLLNAARDFISSDSSTVFYDFFRDHWRVLFLVLCIVGFAMDQIVYLIRWRPRPIWFGRRARRTRGNLSQDAYMPLDGFNDESAIPPNTAVPPEYAYDGENSAPTMQYRMPPQRNGYAPDPQSVDPPYTTPYYAPEGFHSDAETGEIPLHWDEASRGHTFAPADDPQRYAFGMAPSFGSAQSEPAYSYHRDAALTFAPPQEEYPANPYAPQPDPEPMPGEPEPLQAYQQPNPYFRPFSDRDAQTFPPPRSRGLGAVARKARTLLNADEVNQSLTYKDLQSTVDVSKAFHAPVYPEKKPEGDA